MTDGMLDLGLPSSSATLTISTKAGSMPKLRQLALTGYLTELDQLIAELDNSGGDQ